MKPEIFDWDGPQLTPTDYGNEPSLREMIVHYYHSHGIPLRDSERFSQRYIDNFFEQAQPMSNEELETEMEKIVLDL